MHLSVKNAMRRLNPNRGNVLRSVNKRWKDEATQYAEEMIRLGMQSIVVQFPQLHPTRGYRFDTVERVAHA